MPTITTNDWRMGKTVNVGFVRGLLVVERVSQDRKPDAWVLKRVGGNVTTWYRFTPHGGLSKRLSWNDARRP